MRWLLIYLSLGALSISIVILDLVMEPAASSRIQIIVPFAPGGESDTTARLFERALEQHQLVDEPVVVVNIKGAGGTIGSRAAKDAEPDGQTVLLLHDAIFTAKYFEKVPYGYEAFEPVAATGMNNLVLVVSESSPYKTFPQLLEAAKNKPDGIVFGVNRGAPTHLIGLQIRQLVPGTKFRFPQSGGGADRFNDLLGNHVDVTPFSVAEFVQYRSQGLRALVLFAEDRLDKLPNVPTAREFKIEIVSSNMQMWWMPKDTPKEHRLKLANALEKAMQLPEVQARFQERYVKPIFLRDEALLQRIQKRSQEIDTVALVGKVPEVHFPLVIGMGIGLLLLMIGWTSRTNDKEKGESFLAVPHPRMLLLLGITLLYVLVLNQNFLSFRWATWLFVPMMGLVLQRRWEAIYPLLCLAAMLSHGLHLLLTQVAVVSLP